MVSGRSRTGCLTCRQRKLKCDEQKPICSQCLKANRECRPSEAVVFRHQQNASMNATGSQSDGNLPSFYGYRNTFNTNHTWVKIPEQITFVHTSNPFADDLDGESGLNADAETAFDAPRADWGPDATYRTSTSEFAAHSLEHLAAAASDQYQYAQPSGGGPGMISPAPHYTTYNSADIASPPTSTRRGRLANTTRTASYPSSNNISSILNHTTALSPVIDPSLQSVLQRPPTLSDSPAAEKGSLPIGNGERKVQNDHEMVALLRGIAEEHPPQRHEGSHG